MQTITISEVASKGTQPYSSLHSKERVKKKKKKTVQIHLTYIKFFQLKTFLFTICVQNVLSYLKTFNLLCIYCFLFSCSYS